MEIKFEKELITPRIASRWLELNTLNRKINNSTVISYADQMKRGLWREDTGETIKISRDLRLLDGQHRLLAVVRSGVSVRLTVARNINADVFDVLDSGKSRSHADVFTAKKIPNATTVTSGIGAYFSFVKTKKNNRDYKKMKITSHDVLEKYYESPEYWNELCKLGYSVYKNSFRTIPKSFVVGFTCYTDEYSSRPVARDFFNDYQSMTPAFPTVRILREKLISIAVSKQELKPQQKTALIIKAYNAFALQKPLKVLKYTDIEKDYPEII